MVCFVAQRALRGVASQPAAADGRAVRAIARYCCLAGDRIRFRVRSALASIRAWIVTRCNWSRQSGKALVERVLGMRVHLGYIRRYTPLALDKAPLWICTLKTK